MLPRYDIPNAAPQPLREVQLLINSTDLEHERDWLPDWLAERGLGEEDAGRARALREALRQLVLANNGFALDEHAVATVRHGPRVPSSASRKSPSECGVCTAGRRRCSGNRSPSSVR